MLLMPFYKNNLSTDHHGAPQNDSSSPFTIRLYDANGKRATLYRPDEKRTILGANLRLQEESINENAVELSGTLPYRGFMLQARSVQSLNVKRVGRFVQPLPEGARFLQCDNARLRGQPWKEGTVVI